MKHRFELNKWLVDTLYYTAGSIVSSFTATMMMDSLLYGAGSGKMAVIVTGYGHKIAEAISVEVGRGATIMEATGAFAGQPRKFCFAFAPKMKSIRYARLPAPQTPRP